jgi:hypothetical protein
MIKYIFLFFLFFNAFVAHAQQDSTSIDYGEEEGRLAHQKFLDEYEYVFGTKEITRQLLKMNIASLAPTLSINGDNFLTFKFNVDYERKFGKDFSVNAIVTPYFSINNSGLSEKIYRSGLRIGLEPRWYYNMYKKIQARKSADNLSGPYLGFFLEKDKSESVNPAIKNFNDWALLFRYGLQSRFLKYGFADMSIGAGAAYRNKSIELFYDNNQTAFVRIKRDWQPLLSAQVKIGLAFGGGQNQSGGKYCDAFKCFTEEHRLVKIDLLHLIKEFNNQLIVSKGSVGFEQRIGNHPFSIHTELKGAFTRDKSIGNVPNSSGVGQNKQQYLEWAIGIEPRYYYNLRQRIATGKSANNLSANYITLVSEFFSENERANFVNAISDTPVALHREGWRFTPCWGIQRRLFDRGFIDYRLGLGAAYITNDVAKYCPSPDVCNTKYRQTHWITTLKSELKIGLAF